MNKLLGNVFTRHTVKWVVFGVTTYVFINELIIGTPLKDNHSLLILIPLLAFQLRGILWEETYAKELLDARKKLELWRNK